MRTGGLDTLHLSVRHPTYTAHMVYINLVNDQDQEHRLTIKPVKSNKIACKRKIVSVFDVEVGKKSRYILHNTRILLL